MNLFALSVFLNEVNRANDHLQWHKWLCNNWSFRWTEWEKEVRACDVPADVWGRRCWEQTVWVCGSWVRVACGHTRMTFQLCRSCLTAVFFCSGVWTEKPRWSGRCRGEIGHHGSVREMTHVKITHTRKRCFSSDAVVKQIWIKTRSQQAA